MHVVVTGAGTGIGLAIAERLHRDGATLSLMARDHARLAGVARPLGATALRCDIRDQAQVDEAFAAAAEAHGPISVLVANAGIGGANEAGEGDRFEDLVATNLVGTYRCVRAAQRHLAAPPEPRHFVITASILARIAVPGYTGYSASKAGLLGLVRSLAAELGGEDIHVNAICPGWVDTTMAWDGIEGIAEADGISRDAAYARAMEAVPLGRMSQPADIAGVVAWLLSADARGVTGQAIDVNGGAFMH
jgi:ketoreductase